MYFKNHPNMNRILMSGEYVRFSDHPIAAQIEGLSTLAEDYPLPDVAIMVNKRDEKNMTTFIYIRREMDRGVLADIAARIPGLGTVAEEPDIYEDEHGNVLIVFGLN